MKEGCIPTLRALLAALLLLPVAAAAQDTGVALKDDTLRAEPFADAKSVGSLKKGASVTILKRASGWYQIKAGSTQGWVRMLSVRRGEAAQAGAGAQAGGVAALATGRAGTGQIVSTTGVRGLSAEELKAAKFDAAQLRKAESHAVSRADAQAYARQGGLKSVRFDYLPVPPSGGGGQAPKGR